MCRLYVQYLQKANNVWCTSDSSKTKEKAMAQMVKRVFEFPHFKWRVVDAHGNIVT